MAESQTQKQMAAGVAGLFDPVLRKLAQRLAETVPLESPLRNESVEAVIGALKGLIEIRAEKLSILPSVVVKELTDLADFFSGALGPAAIPDLEKWVGEITQEAGPRLRNAADPVAELERIKLEIRLRKEIVEIIKQEVLVGQVKKPMTSELEGINSVLAGWRDSVKNWAETNAPKEKSS